MKGLEWLDLDVARLRVRMSGYVATIAAKSAELRGYVLSDLTFCIAVGIASMSTTGQSF
jgi:hypothetical protein